MFWNLKRLFKKKVYLILSLFIILILAILLSKDSLLQRMGNFLVVEDDFRKSDVIIVLGGELKGERTKKAVELYKLGYAPTIILSDGTDLSWRTKAVDEMYDLALLLGVPPSSIYKEDDSRSTYENAVYTKQLLVNGDWKSAIVVTTNWHSRRVKSTFTKVYHDTSIILHYASASDHIMPKLEQWWEDSEKQQIILSEWAKFIVYKLKYRI